MRSKCSKNEFKAVQERYKKYDYYKENIVLFSWTDAYKQGWLIPYC